MTPSGNPLDPFPTPPPATLSIPLAGTSFRSAPDPYVNKNVNKGNATGGVRNLRRNWVAGPVQLPLKRYALGRMAVVFPVPGRDRLETGWAIPWNWVVTARRWKGSKSNRQSNAPAGDSWAGNGICASSTLGCNLMGTLAALGKHSKLDAACRGVANNNAHSPKCHV